MPVTAACLLLLAFASARAVLVPLTYDEAATYLRYVATDFLSVFNFGVANNHFVNSLLTKLSFLVFGSGELALRLPNLAAYGVYLVFCVLILRELRHHVVASAGFLLMNLNPYLLDYFALSRGYGLSLAFLMGGLFFFFRFLANLRTGAGSDSLRAALMCACGAVMANFALLNVFLAFLGVALVAIVAANAVHGAPSDARQPDPAARSPRPAVVWLPATAAVFVLLVFSQDIALSDELFQQVTIGFSGLSDGQLDTVRVARFDVAGRALPIPRQAGTPMWRLDRPTQVAGLRTEMPAAAADKLALIEVTIGKRAFWHDRLRDGGWTALDKGAMRIFESGPALSLPRSRTSAYRKIINWSGDGRYCWCVVRQAALALAALAALALALKGVGAIAGRLKLLSADQWRPLASAALWIAALAGPPLYGLTRNRELYFGGVNRFVDDTVYSLIEGSCYGRTYLPNQNQVVFLAVLATLAVSAFVLVLGYRRRLASVLPAASVLAIVVIAAGSVIAQHHVFGIQYLGGRTALFFIPLYLLFVTLSCETLAGLGRGGEALATFGLVVALSLSAFHFAASANLQKAADWPDDAGTRAMMEDLCRIVAAEKRPRVVLGVEARYSAAAAYYARMQRTAVIDIVVVPAPSDFLYVRERNRGDATTVLGRYPAAHSLLARAGTVR